MTALCPVSCRPQIAIAPQYDSVEGVPEFRVVLHSGDMVIPACHEGTNRSQVCEDLVLTNTVVVLSIGRGACVCSKWGGLVSS